MDNELHDVFSCTFSSGHSNGSGGKRTGSKSWLGVLISLALALCILPNSVMAVDELGIYEIDEDAIDDQAAFDDQAWNGTYAIIDGLLDLDNDGVAGETNDDDDSASLLGSEIIEGLVNIDGQGGIDQDDDGTWDGIEVIYGLLDVSGDGVSPSRDRGIDAENFLAGNNPGTAIYEYSLGQDDTLVVDQTKDIPECQESSPPDWCDSPNSDLTLHTGGESKDPEVIIIYEPRNVINGLVDLDEDDSIDSGDGGVFDIYALVNGWVDTNLNGVTHEEDDDGTYYGIAVIDGYLDMDGDGVDDPGTLATADPDDDGSIDYWVDGWKWSEGNLQVKNDIYNVWASTALYTGADLGIGADSVAWNGTYAVIDSLLDLDNDGIGGETNGDDSQLDLLGEDIIDGEVDIDGDGSIDDFDDDGTWDGITIIDGKLDVNADTRAPSAEHHTGDMLVYFGGDTIPATGSAAYSFWFLQDSTVTNIDAQGTNANNKQWTGSHQVGDLLIQTDIVSGGTESRVYVWNPDPPGTYPVEEPNPIPNLTLIFETTTCVDSGGTKTQPVCTISNQREENQPAGWTYQQDSDPPQQTVHWETNFIEGGANISEIFRRVGVPVPCFSKMLAETRSTTSTSGTLTDFYGVGFQSCGLNVTKSGDSVVMVGDTVNFTISIENTGLLPLTLDDVSDPVCDAVDQLGPGGTLIAALAAGCSYLEPGDSCTFEVPYITQQGDANPLLNTVTAEYLGPDGAFVDGADDHPVTLIYPGFIGDQVWLDEDGNGVFDAGEDGLAGTTVILIPELNVIGGGIDINGNGVVNSGDDGEINGTAIVNGFLDLDGDGAITSLDDSSTYGTFQGISVVDGVLQSAPATVDGDTQTTVTDANGEYIFTDLPNGDYTISLDVPSGMNATYDADGGYDNTTDITLAQGEFNTTTDFGLNWVPPASTDNPVAGQTGAIGDRVWNDADGDGVQDEGESGLDGVGVVLAYDSNADGVIDKV
jgi:uncharacterized repeat protein (TIGR01451 family)